MYTPLSIQKYVKDSPMRQLIVSFFPGLLQNQLPDRGTPPSMQSMWTTAIMKTHSRFLFNPCFVQQQRSQLCWNFVLSGAAGSVFFAFVQPRVGAEQAGSSCERETVEARIPAFQGEPHIYKSFSGWIETFLSFEWLFSTRQIRQDTSSNW